MKNRPLRREPIFLSAALLVVLGILGLVKLTGEVREGDTFGFDGRVLKAFRRTDDPARLVGPAWTFNVVRDITSLGGAAVLLLLTGSVAGFLVLARKPHMMWLMLASIVGAVVINTGIKKMVERPRPTIVPQLMRETTPSFPSGHSAMSACVYLTMGSLLSQSVSRRRFKIYFLTVAGVLTLLVGASRVALGVHYPTDVLAGWCTGLVWALCCWLVGRYLQTRGAVEEEDEGTIA